MNKVASCNLALFLGGVTVNDSQIGIVLVPTDKVVGALENPVVSIVFGIVKLTFQLSVGVFVNELQATCGKFDFLDILAFCAVGIGNHEQGSVCDTVICCVGGKYIPHAFVIGSESVGIVKLDARTFRRVVHGEHDGRVCGQLCAAFHHKVKFALDMFIKAILICVQNLNASVFQVASSFGLSAQTVETRHDKAAMVAAVRTFLFMIPPKKNLADGNIEIRCLFQYFFYVTCKI